MKTKKHKVTQKDLDTNRFMKEEKLKVGDIIEIAVTESKPAAKKPKKGAVAASADDEVECFVTEDGVKLPIDIEGHKIQSVVDTKEVNGVINYNCLCDDGCTYHTVAVS